ncbi:hypothetical protein DOY81_007222 [Sarcophaga bullata]|nr:hypothetical protein DOY81_007222 [Sarcophaga bullata]
MIRTLNANAKKKQIIFEFENHLQKLLKTKQTKKKNFLLL